MSGSPNSGLEMPTRGARVYAWIALVVAIIGLLLGGLDKLALLPDSAAKACRAFYFCGPRPLKKLPPFDTIQPSGSTWRSVEQDQVPPQQRIVEQDNPDYLIEFVPGKEEDRGCDALGRNCRFDYPGMWSARPKWHSLFDYIFTWIILGFAALGASFIAFRRRSMALPE